MIKKMKLLAELNMWVTDRVGAYRVSDKKVAEYNREVERHGYVDMLIESFDGKERYYPDDYNTSSEMYQVLQFISEQYELEHNVDRYIREYDIEREGGFPEAFPVLESEYDFDDLVNVDTWIQSTKEEMLMECQEEMIIKYDRYAWDNPYDGVSLGDLLREILEEDKD